jgi:hypothetical protein
MMRLENTGDLLEMREDKFGRESHAVTASPRPKPHASADRC